MPAHPSPACSSWCRDVELARAELLERGVAVDPVTRMGEGDASAFIYFSDPDGNSWAVQEIRNRGDWLPS